MASILIIISEGCEEMEYMIVADILARAQHQICVAAGKELQVTGSRGLPLTAQCLLDDVHEEKFDLVYLPGGIDQAQFCCSDPYVQKMIARRLTQNQLLAIICASPLALLPQNLAQGRNITSYPAMRADLEAKGAIWSEQRVIQDQQLITSQGPGTAMELGLYLVRVLGDSAQEQEISEQLLASARAST